MTETVAEAPGINLHPLVIARHPAFRAGGQKSSDLFRKLATEYGVDNVDNVGIAWIQACLAIDQGAA